MPFVTLIAAPGSGALDTALVSALRGAWGGGRARWLAPREAAEFEVPRAPENRWQVWQDMQRLGVDLAVQAERGPKRMLIADMDSTMIGQECIDELAAAAGIGARVAEITARAMNGELEFEAALKARVALLAGLPETVIKEVLDTRITPAPGAAALVATMRAGGAYTALVSGGFTRFTGAVAAWLGFDTDRANRLIAVDGMLTGEVGEPILGRQAKIDALHEIAAARGIAAAEVIAVGDGANDLDMLHAAGAGVALHAKPAVAAACELRINHGDLTALLYLQGYRRDQFVAP